MSVNRVNVGRAASCVAAGGRRGVGLEGARVGFSAMPLEREDLLVDATKGAVLKGR